MKMTEKSFLENEAMLLPSAYTPKQSPKTPVMLLLLLLRPHNSTSNSFFLPRLRYPLGDRIMRTFSCNFTDADRDWKTRIKKKFSGSVDSL